MRFGLGKSDPVAVTRTIEKQFWSDYSRGAANYLWLWRFLGF
jgi:hypothetical protein